MMGKRKNITFLSKLLVIILLSSCAVGGQIVFDETTSCVVSKNNDIIRALYIEVTKGDSVYDYYKITKKEEKEGRQRICLREIPDDYEEKHIEYGAMLIRFEKKFNIEPNCKYKIESCGYADVPSSIIYLYSDPIGDLHEYSE